MTVVIEVRCNTAASAADNPGTRLPGDILKRQRASFFEAVRDHPSGLIRGGQENVHIAVMVEIGDTGPLCITRVQERQGVGRSARASNVLESAIPEVTQQHLDFALVGDEQINPSVLIEIDPVG